MSSGTVSGDKKYHVPPLEPFKIPELRVNPDGDNQAVGFSVLIKNCTVSGVKNVHIDDINFDFEEVKKNGLTYIALKNSHVDVNLGRANIHLENLFNGDKLLGDNMNKFLNENWREVVDDVAPPFTQALAEMMGNIFSGVFELVSVEEAFI
uniref:Uncharacterized protein n=1 Tax=Timema tahoe TaxID=61484 RepID=A0A7R9NYC6_9NEOP|nr:unnamed protein product [Timema tahoe]